MSPSETFYRERASDARRDAGAANLSNVRERCLRAAEAWEQMASRAARTDQLRAESEARKLELTLAAL